MVEDNWEKDEEANWAITALMKEVEKSKQRGKAREDLIRFMEAHPDFKEYYELLKAVERY